MRSNPFYFEIKDVITQFVSAFNDIVIKRHDKYRNPRSQVKVRYVYAPKQRVIHDITNKARHITLPVAAVNIASISRDESRVFNKLFGAYMSSGERHPSQPRTISGTTSYNIPQPVPINIEVNMSVLARYQTDIEQIMSNFIPYNDPYIMLSWKLPEEFFPKDQEIRSEVMWSGNLNMNYPDDLSGNESYRLGCDTSFTIKTWLFKKAPKDPVSTIYKITTNMSTDLDFELDTLESSTTNTVGPPLTGAPYITYVDEHGSSRQIIGYNMNSTTNAYVSGTNINQLSGERVDIHGDRQISTYYPAFTGVPVDFTINNDNSLNVVLPKVDHDETVDLILTNAAGYATSMTSPHHSKPVEIKSQ